MTELVAALISIHGMLTSITSTRKAAEEDSEIVQIADAYMFVGKRTGTVQYKTIFCVVRNLSFGFQLFWQKTSFSFRSKTITALVTPIQNCSQCMTKALQFHPDGTLTQKI